VLAKKSAAGMVFVCEPRGGEGVLPEHGWVLLGSCELGLLEAMLVMVVMPMSCCRGTRLGRCLGDVLGVCRGASRRTSFMLFIMHSVFSFVPQALPPEQCSC
jgi:hypothetical protein